MLLINFFIKVRLLPYFLVFTTSICVTRKRKYEDLKTKTDFSLIYFKRREKTNLLELWKLKTAKGTGPSSGNKGGEKFEFK